MKFIPDNRPKEFKTLWCFDALKPHPDSILPFLQDVVNDCTRKGYVIDTFDYGHSLVSPKTGKKVDNQSENKAVIAFAKIQNVVGATKTCCSIPSTQLEEKYKKALADAIRVKEELCCLQREKADALEFVAQLKTTHEKNVHAQHAAFDAQIAINDQLRTELAECQSHQAKQDQLFTALEKQRADLQDENQNLRNREFGSVLPSREGRIKRFIRQLFNKTH